MFGAKRTEICENRRKWEILIFRMTFLFQRMLKIQCVQYRALYDLLNIKVDRVAKHYKIMYILGLDMRIIEVLKISEYGIYY